MTQSSIIPYLFLVTFIIALAYGIVQFRKAKKAKAEGHTSASARQGAVTGTANQPSSTAATASAGGNTADKSPPIVPR